MDPSPGDDPSDTALARALHARSALGLDALRASLDEVRRRRGTARATDLTRVLLERALITPEEARQVAPTSREGPDPATGDALPARLGPYRLVRELARGGMGAVHEAVHEATGARYAVKTLLPQALAGGRDGEAFRRFRREAELGARLDHPHVVRVHSADLDGPVPFLVQDLLGGGSLEDRLRSGGPLPVVEAVALARKVTAGLAHAHAHGVLHRDLKPANVLLDERGEPRLVDFGLARRMDPGASRLTAAGDAMGTPTYMAPEQALDASEVDARADVYAVGALLHALLTGGPPFMGRTSVEVMEQVVTAAPPSVRQARPEVPAALEALVLRCLAKDPAARFPSAAALEAALAACLAADADPDGSPGRRPPLVGGLAVVAVVAVLAAGLAVVVGSRRRAGPEADPRPPGPAAPDPPRRGPLPPPGATPSAPARASAAPGWGPTLGRACRWSLRWSNSYEGEESVLELIVAQQEPRGVGQARVSARIEALRLHLVEITRLDWDSTAPLASSALPLPELGPFLAAAASASLSISLDLRTGTVQEVRGMPAPPSLKDDDMLTGAVNRLARCLSDDAVRKVLDGALHVFPPDAPPGAAWDLQGRTWPMPGFAIVGKRRFSRDGDVVDMALGGPATTFPDPAYVFVHPPELSQVQVSGRVTLEGDRVIESRLTQVYTALLEGESQPRRSEITLRLLPP